MKNVINSISEKIQHLQAIDDQNKLTSKEVDFLKRLHFCYEILARSDFASDICFAPEDDICYRMDIEPGTYLPCYPYSSDLLANAVNSIFASKPDLFSLLDIVKYTMSLKNISVRQIATDCKLRQSTIYDFLSGKSSMRSGNIEKIIKYCISR